MIIISVLQQESFFTIQGPGSSIVATGMISPQSWDQSALLLQQKSSSRTLGPGSSVAATRIILYNSGTRQLH
jgi:hypothetical protein